MSKIDEWANDKPLNLAMWAQQFVAAAEELYEVLGHSKQLTFPSYFPNCLTCKKRAAVEQVDLPDIAAY